MGVIAAVGMAAASSLAQYQQGRAQARAYESQASADEANAKIEERKREQVNLQSLDERRRLISRAKDIEGQNTAAFGAGGIDASSGTALALKTANNAVLNQDLGMNAYNLGLEDTALRQNVANYNQSAASNRAAAKSSKRTATIGAILSFASSMAGIQSMQAASKKATDAGDTTAGAINGSNIFASPYNYEWYNSPDAWKKVELNKSLSTTPKIR